MVKALAKSTSKSAPLHAAEKLIGGEWGEKKHPLRVIKRRFGQVKKRYRGLKKNTQQLIVCAEQFINGAQQTDGLPSY